MTPWGSIPGWVWLKSLEREEVLLLETCLLRLPSLLERRFQIKMSGKAFSSPTSIGDSLQDPRLSVLL